MTTRPHPPRLASAFLDLLVGPLDRGSVRHELHELYEMRVDTRGVPDANRWYRRQVLAFAIRILRHGRRRERRPFRKGDGLMSKFFYDLRQAIRRLGRAPVFSAVAILTIGIGVGVVTSVFALVDSVLIEKMPYRSPEQLVWVWRNYSWINFPQGWLGGPDVVALREQSDTFEAVTAVRSGIFNLSSDDANRASRVKVLRVSHEFFDMLGVSPMLGRGFRPEESLPSANPVAVLGYNLWRTQFGADSSVVGTGVMVNGNQAQVIGVASPDLHFVQQASLSEPIAGDLYMNLALDLADQDPGSGFLAGLARIRSGVTPDQLEVALDRAAEVIDAAFDNKGLHLWAQGVKTGLTADVAPALSAIMASAGFLFLILTANLATLLLGRAALRQREIGIRTALGAGRSRVVSSVLSEALVLGAAGGGLGLVLAAAGTRGIIRLAPQNLPRLDEVGMDGTAVLVALAVTAVAVFAAGIPPALRSLRGSLVGALKEGSLRSGDTLRGVRARSGLVVGQVALSLMLLVGAGMVARAFAGLLRSDPGFNVAPALTFRVTLAGNADVIAFHRAFRGRLAGLPGLGEAGATSALPLSQVTNQTDVRFPGAEGNTGDRSVDRPLVDWFRVTPGYLESAGFRLLGGRTFEDGDGERRVAIIDDVLARQFFPNGSAVGRTVLFRDTLTIIGVVDQARLYDVHHDDRGQLFVLLDAAPTRVMDYVVRTDDDPLALTDLVRAAAREVDPTVPVSDLRTLDAIVADSLGRQRLSLTLLASFAGGALLLAILGVYGVVSNGVVRRRQEIGVRMALGADRRRVIGLVLGQGLRLAVAGAVIGVAGAVATSRLLNSVMVGVDPSNPAVYVVVAAAVLAVSTIASWVPARWATRIDPMSTLRAE